MGTATMTVITVLSSGTLADLLEEPQAAPAIAVLAFTLALAGASVVPYAMLQRRFQQRDVRDRCRRTDRVDDGGADRIGLGFAVAGLAIGRVTAQIVVVAVRPGPREAALCDPPIGGRSRARIRRRRRCEHALAGLLNVDNIILARVAGATALGYYVLAFNISSWPMSALAQVVRSISLPISRSTRAGTRPCLANRRRLGRRSRRAPSSQLSPPR